MAMMEIPASFPVWSILELESSARLASRSWNPLVRCDKHCGHPTLADLIILVHGLIILYPQAWGTYEDR